MGNFNNVVKKKSYYEYRLDEAQSWESELLNAVNESSLSNIKAIKVDPDFEYDPCNQVYWLTISTTHNNIYHFHNYALCDKDDVIDISKRMIERINHCKTNKC